MIQVLQGDNVERLREMPDASIHLCVTSPPYGQLRAYRGNLAWDFESVAKELFRVLCVGGVLCWNVGDEVIQGSEGLESCEQKIFFRRECGFVIHDTMIWHKLNFSSPSFNRYHQCFEYVFIFSKGKPRCFNPIKDKPNSTAGRLGNLGVNTFMKRDGERETRSKHITQELGMRHNVWKGKTRGQEAMCEKLPHPAMMPRWLARDLILSWSNPGDTVLDPFAGSGTTGEEATKLARNAILIEKEPEYVDLCQQNINATTPGLPI